MPKDPMKVKLTKKQMDAIRLDAQAMNMTPEKIIQITIAEKFKP
jgi:hypothetical protein